MKKLVIGILAHVDAGKTTLSEALLVRSGVLRTAGRVDHGNAFLDTDALERTRGITIFSKQAIFSTKALSATLIDTPGHTDFSAEMERALRVLDCAILLVSAADGIQAHTETLWHLLRRSKIPTFLFINKTDLPGFDETQRMEEVRRAFGERCVDFTNANTPKTRAEAAAACDELLLERYLETDFLSDEELQKAVAQERLFPCYFGSALRMTGIDELLRGLEDYAPSPVFDEDFSARAYRVSYDSQGNRMTYLKITGGTLAVRDPVTYFPHPNSEESVTEKVTQLRLYSGAKYEAVPAVQAGDVCAVLGLGSTYPGQGLGKKAKAFSPLLEPVMSYRILPPEDCDPRVLLQKLRRLEEENPQLHLCWDDALREIRAQFMGEIEIEIFRRRVEELTGVCVTVDTGRILYRETIAAPVEGVGHYEPLRHYAEVHLLLEPLPRGSGLESASFCSEDVLSRNWQRLVRTHLEERTHRGVLTGSPITDLRITLTAGRAHPKHTEGGDFRQATYRAVRQALMKAQSILLEPVEAFRLEVPFEQTGRAITDLHAMGASFSQPEESNGKMLLRGRAPLSALRAYAQEVTAYTHGKGRLFCEPDGYEPCQNAKHVIDEIGYDPLRDPEHTPDSVFCSHGAGTVIPWNQVEQYMHLEGHSISEKETTGREFSLRSGPLSLDDRELQAIFAREFAPPRTAWTPSSTIKPLNFTPTPPPRKQFLIVDGYNVVFTWEELRTLARDDLDAARKRLLDLLVSYSSYRRCNTAVIFDAYRVSGHKGVSSEYHGIHVLYTREGETGDLYIERLVGEIGKNDSVRVVTSDSLIQLSALRSGVLRMSARELYEDVISVQEQIHEKIRELDHKGRLTKPQPFSPLLKEDLP